MLYGEGASLLYRWYDWGLEFKWFFFVVFRKVLGIRFVFDNFNLVLVLIWGLWFSCGFWRNFVVVLGKWLFVFFDVGCSLELFGKFFEKKIWCLDYILD